MTECKYSVIVQTKPAVLKQASRNYMNVRSKKRKEHKEKAERIIILSWTREGRTG